MDPAAELEERTGKRVVSNQNYLIGKIQKKIK